MRLPTDVDHTARAAGGLKYLECCPTDELQWAKKRFIEDLTRQRKSGAIAFCLPESSLGKLLRHCAPSFALPTASPQLTRSPEELEKIANLLRQAGTYQKKWREVDPAMAATLKRAEGRFAESNQRVFAEYRKEHGL